MPPTQSKILRWVLFATFALLPGAAAAQGAPPRVVLGTPDITQFPDVQITVSALGANGIPVADLTPEQFQVIEDGTAQPIASLQKTTNAAASVFVVVAMDVSGSMAGKALDDAKSAIGGFAESLAPTDQVGVMSFGGQGNTCFVDSGPGLTSNRDELRKFLDGAQASGDTPIYDAAVAAIQIAGTAPQGRRLAVVITDGADTCSKVSYDTVVQASLRTGIPLYLIGLGDKLQQDLMQSLALQTGGEYIAVADSGRLASIYQKLSERLKTQYVLTYRSKVVADGRDHVTQVKVRSEAGETSGEARFRPATVPLQLRLSVNPNQRIDGPTQVDVGPTSDQLLLRRAEFYLDNQQVAVATAAPFAHIVAPDSLAARTRTLRVKATDRSGADAEMSVPLQFAAAGIQVGLKDGQTIDTPTTVVATTREPAQLRRAEFLVDGALLHTATQAPFEWVLDPSQISAGARRVVVRGTDARGATAETAVSVEVPASGLPMWVLMAGALVLPIAALVGVFAFAGKRKLRCPRCRRVLQPGWSTCPFCAQQPASAGPAQSYALGMVNNGAAPVIVSPSRPLSGSPLDPLPSRTLIIGAGGSVVGGYGPRFVVKTGPLLGDSLPIGSGGDIGRAQGVAIHLDDPTVSHHHARVQVESGRVVIQDMGSSNGTRVNGTPVARHELRPGDTVQLGQTTLVYEQDA